MKLEVGMYIRTKKGLIAKYIKINNKYEWHVFDNKIQWFYEYYRNEIDFDSWKDFIKEKVVKASHNIIDLIEVGDYVNGLQVIEAREHLHNDIEIVLTNGSFNWSFSKNESDYKIKSIVTKEQFEAMKYEIK